MRPDDRADIIIDLSKISRADREAAYWRWFRRFRSRPPDARREIMHGLQLSFRASPMELAEYCEVLSDLTGEDIPEALFRQWLSGRSVPPGHVLFMTFCLAGPARSEVADYLSEAAN